MIDHIEVIGSVEVDISDVCGFLVHRPGADHRLTFRVSDHSYITFVLTTDELNELGRAIVSRLERTGQVHKARGGQQSLVERMHPTKL